MSDDQSKSKKITFSNHLENFRSPAENFDNSLRDTKRVNPPCRIFGQCGGCQYQDIPYDEELQTKEVQLKNLFLEKFGRLPGIFNPIVPSPIQYHYRHRLDLKLMKFRNPLHPLEKEICMDRC